MKKEIVSIYENIYNQELVWKNNLDNKFASRLTLLITLITATFIIFTTVFFPNSENSIVVDSNATLWCQILNITTMILTLFFFASFYRCFFRKKLNYKVMPTDEIRMFHFYIHRNNLCGTPDEEDLYNYLNDSYQFCANVNATINTKREKALILFDNLASILFIILIITYIFMVKSGYSINWIF